MFILLADDERMVRLGLEAMLDELYPYEHIYIHAKNGKQMIEQIVRQPPDIAFVDIKMPLMNGLDALSECRKKSPYTSWIILSGYADFHYAQTAISLSVLAYILKPISIETLKSLMEKVIKSKSLNLEQKHSSFCHDIIRSFNLADQLDVKEIDFLPHGKKPYTIYQFYIDKMMKDEQHFIKQSLYDKLNSYCSNNTIIRNYCLFFRNSGQLCLICISLDRTRLTRYINEQTQKFPDGLLAVFYGSGNTVKDIYLVSRKIASISPIKMISNLKQATEINFAHNDLDIHGKLTFCNQMEYLSTLFMDGNMGSFKQQLNAMTENNNFKETFKNANIIIFYQYLYEIYRHKFTASTYEDFLDEINECTNQTPDLCCNIKLDISKIQDFIYNNFNKDVSLVSVSEYYNISPTYLSRIFHQKTGKKYIDFVTEVRMENAKRILLEYPSVLVKTVAEEVGYSSVRHFSKIFQKYTGVLPSFYYDNESP